MIATLLMALAFTGSPAQNCTSPTVDYFGRLSCHGTYGVSLAGGSECPNPVLRDYFGRLSCYGRYGISLAP